MSDNAVLSAFASIFRGDTFAFVKHQIPFKKDKEGKVKAKWCGFAEYNNKYAPPPEGKEEGDKIPLTIEKYREHLNGGDGLAVSPLMNVMDETGDVIKRNVCYFAALDIDVVANFTFLVQKLYKHGFQFVATISKSGGLHVNFFFNEAEPADKVIATLSRIVEVFGLDRLYVNAKQKNKVEIFPKQATYVPGDKNANCLLLPFYNAGDKDKCIGKMLTAEGKLLGITKALQVIESMFTSVSGINAVIDALPYRDAPYCIQMILLTGALAEGDGRSNFLFSAGVYLKKKYQGDFDCSLLEEMNDCLEVPLGAKDVTSTYKSVTNKERNYDGYKCKDFPCADYCDKKLCKLREYGVGREKGNHNTGADYWGLLTRYDTGDGKEPYYIWEVQVPERDKVEKVQIDSHKDLLNQSVVQQNCLRDLNWVPWRVKDNDWVKNVLNGLINIEERTIKVERTADTTEMSMLRGSFLRYLTHNQIQKNSQPYMVMGGQVYHGDGAFYFTTEGILKFLQFEKCNVGRVNLREWFIRQGCEENAELKYTTIGGVEKTVTCWKMPETDELRSMNSFYEDIYEGDADIIQKMKFDEDAEGDDGDTGF